MSSMQTTTTIKKTPIFRDHIGYLISMLWHGGYSICCVISMLIVINNVSASPFGSWKAIHNRSCGKNLNNIMNIAMNANTII